MVRHIVSWKFPESLSAEEKRAHAQTIKARLEALPKTIEGIVDLVVVEQLLDSSSTDLALISTFESEAALRAYQVHPAHKEVSAFVRSVIESRFCVDYKL